MVFPLFKNILKMRFSVLIWVAYFSLLVFLFLWAEVLYMYSSRLGSVHG